MTSKITRPWQGTALACIGWLQVFSLLVTILVVLLVTLFKNKYQYESYIATITALQSSAQLSGSLLVQFALCLIPLGLFLLFLIIHILKGKKWSITCLLAFSSITFLYGLWHLPLFSLVCLFCLYLIHKHHHHWATFFTFLVFYLIFTISTQQFSSIIWLQTIITVFLALETTCYFHPFYNHPLPQEHSPSPPPKSS